MFQQSINSHFLSSRSPLLPASLPSFLAVPCHLVWKTIVMLCPYTQGPAFSSSSSTSSSLQAGSSHLPNLAFQLSRQSLGNTLPTGQQRPQSCSPVIWTPGQERSYPAGPICGPFSEGQRAWIVMGVNPEQGSGKDPTRSPTLLRNTNHTILLIPACLVGVAWTCWVQL